jgi:hypothetical protein
MSATVDFSSIDGLRAAGFEGFSSFADLDGSRCTEVPVARGVYVVLRTSEAPPRFMPSSSAPHWRGMNPSVAIEALTEKWVPGAIVLYIGEAGGSGVRGQLQQRIKRRLRFAKGASVGAWGGRYLWQLADARSLRFAWKPCDDPKQEEAGLLAAFAARYGTLPFANLRMEQAEE